MRRSDRGYPRPLLQSRPRRDACAFVARLVRCVLDGPRRHRRRAQSEGHPRGGGGHLQWKTAAEEIRRERAQGKTDAIVLVGHSQGANNVIDMARVLEAQNVPVALLVTLAPYRQDPVPANVMRAINYYQSGGWGAPLTAGPGFRGKLSNVDVAEDSSVSHINIDKSARIQAEIAREIGAIARAK